MRKPHHATYFSLWSTAAASRSLSRGQGSSQITTSDSVQLGSPESLRKYGLGVELWRATVSACHVRKTIVRSYERSLVEVCLQMRCGQRANHFTPSGASWLPGDLEADGHMAVPCPSALAAVGGGDTVCGRRRRRDSTALHATSPPPRRGRGAVQGTHRGGPGAQQF